MMQATPTAIRALRWVLAAAVASFSLASGRPVWAQDPVPSKPATSPAGFTILQGYVIDSIHNQPLVNATVTIEGTGRAGKTTVDGRYRIDSIPAGSHRVILTHPLLDTLGVFSLRAGPYPFGA